MAPQALEPLAVVVAGAEEERDQLAGLELATQVVELGGKLEGRAARDLGGLVGSLQEDERAGEPVGGVPPSLRVAGALVGVAKRVGRVRQRRQRLRAPELEEQLGPELGRQRLGERAAQRGDRRIRRALREGGARGRAEDVDDPVLAAARHRQDVRGDLLGRGVALEQEPRRALVAQLALARREVAVDGGLHERMDEAERRLGPQDLRANELSARRGDGLAVEAGERADDRELRAVAEDGERSAPRSPRRGESRASRRSTARDAARGPSSATTSTCAASGGTCSASSVFRSSLSSSGLPCVEAWQASANAGSDSVAQPLANDLRGGVGAERPGHEHAARRVARRARRAAPRPPPGSDGRRLPTTSTGSAFEPPREVGEEAERRAVAPVQVVDREQQRRLRAQVHGQPVEAVQRGEGRLAARLVVCAARPGGRRSAAAAPAAPGRARARARASSARCGSNSWRTTPNGKSRSSSLPRADRTSSPRSAARRRASATSRDLPIPAGPSISTSPARPASVPAIARSSASSSRSRSSRRRARSDAPPPPPWAASYGRSRGGS